MTEQYNTKNAGVRRLMQEAKELRQATEMYHAQPMEDNLFEWHFTIRGTIGTDFEGGIYHGRIIFPADYPMKPPNLILLTPNGRFELNKKICLSISGYHPETWLPSWSIRTALLALIGFLPSTPGGALGSLDYPPKERKRLAKLSGDWKCKECGCVMKDALLPITEDGQLKETEEAKKLAAQLKFQDESVVKKEIADANGSASEEIQSSETTQPETSEVTNDSSESDESSEDSSGEETEAEQPVDPEPAIRDPSPTPLFQQPARQLASRSFDYSLLIKIPLALICLAVFMTLVARRILVESGNSFKEGPEL
ncbi:hypothetical protein GCK72_006519 [Caenorhabditis remanei]|uniref:UBC core domain-containing protein n=1 Tax=Caenorhabditis remanei TaxID=31234 RepID=A0A6A5HL01_CAERE|nr:hypothetical protein GCK72_006519 [Caenorhabditis remanei]KAF1766562.1 hypothetical protein GCK72_006519 [Caenorhabditis remanei]